MNHDLDHDSDAPVPGWAVFGDLMSVLLGAFVLILVSVIGVQLDLSSQLDHALKQQQEETQRRQALEQALADPLATGRVTWVNGRIGISGSVLFALNSDQLQEEGLALIKSLAQPLAAYLQTRQDILMISGFTDNQPIRTSNSPFVDNWNLSAQRALTVTRALIEAGLPASSVFAAAFGAEQPVASNANAEGRAQNRRVEIAPMPRPAASASAPALPAAHAQP